MKAEICCAVLLCLMGSMAGAATSGNIAGSIESDPIDPALILDLAYVPVQVAQVMLVQTASVQNAQPVNGNVITAPSEKDMAYCQDVESVGIPKGGSAFNSLPVLQGVFGRLGYSWDNATNNFNAPLKVIADVINSKVIVAITPQHGTVARLASGSYFWQYTPIAGYVGTDKVSFLVEYQGRHFKITVNLLVHESAPEGPDNLEDLQNYTPPCFEVFPPGSSNETKNNRNNRGQTTFSATDVNSNHAHAPNRHHPSFNAGSASQYLPDRHATSPTH